MLENKSKFQLFKSFKDSILNSKTEDPKVTKTQEVETSVDVNTELGETIPKTTLVKEEKKIVEPYKTVSNSSFLDERFAMNFVQSGGKFVFCEDNTEFFHFLNSLKKEKKWNHIFSWNYDLLDFLQENKFQQNDLEIEIQDADAAMSYCFKLSAEEGVIVLSPEQATNRRLVNFPNTHIIIAYKNQLKTNVLEAIKGFSEGFGERLPSLLELHEEKPVCKENHKFLLNAEGPTDVYLFYIDTDIID